MRKSGEGRGESFGSCLNRREQIIRENEKKHVFKGAEHGTGATKGGGGTGTDQT